MTGFTGFLTNPRFKRCAQARAQDLSNAPRDALPRPTDPLELDRNHLLAAQAPYMYALGAVLKLFLTREGSLGRWQARLNSCFAEARERRVEALVAKFKDA